MRTAINLDPGSTVAYNNLGRVYEQQHKYDDAAAQFRKQIVINPEDHYAHANLGELLRTEKKCSEAMPELRKALSLTPNKADVLLALGACDIGLGNQAKGLSELEQATSVSSAPGTWNTAAYILAEQKIELARAEEWSDASLNIEALRLQGISLDHLTAEQLNYVFWVAHYWGTQGWICFLRGDSEKAQGYVEASWQLLPLPTIGDHLGQIYEKAGRPADAIRVYAMAIASADRQTRAYIDPDDVADARQRLGKLDPHVDSLIERGRADLAAMRWLSVPNACKCSGSAAFALLIGGREKAVRLRKISGDAPLDKAVNSLQAIPIPFKIPAGTDIEIPLRGTLNCKSSDDQCRFALLDSEAAVDVARNESAPDTAQLAEGQVPDPHVYDSPAIGIRFSLADEWKLVKEEAGSFSRPHAAVFGKPGSLAFFTLMREHLESTPDLYKKLVESYFSKRPDFRNKGEEEIKRDGISGTRWSMSWNENGNVPYSAVVEFFTVGDDHYVVAASAPQEVYDRYVESFANMLRSVQFPMLHADPRVLEDAK